METHRRNLHPLVKYCNNVHISCVKIDIIAQILRPPKDKSSKFNSLCNVMVVSVNSRLPRNVKLKLKVN